MDMKSKIANKKTATKKSFSEDDEIVSKKSSSKSDTDDDDDEDLDLDEKPVKKGKASAKKGKGDEDDLGLDDDFKTLDLFDDGAGLDDEEDEDF